MAGRRFAIAVVLVSLTIGGCSGDTMLGKLMASSTGPKAKADQEPLSRPMRDVPFVGMKVDDLQALLGQPSLRRIERSAQFWRYRFIGCDLDIYVFDEPSPANARVGFVRVRYDQAIGAEPSCADLESNPQTSKRDQTTGLPLIVLH